jgi:hypothetical protein
MAETYLGNPLLKPAGIQIDFSKEEIEEYVKCSRDAKYFIENYIKIVNVDKGLVSFNLYDFQQAMVDTFVDNRFSICKLPRQSGKSTTVVGYILWNILFHDNQNCAILANKGALARDLLAKIQLSYENLPKWIQQGVITWNKGNIELENGSKVVSAATSSSAIRGGSYNLIFLDEFAFVGMNLAEEFFASVYPTISSGSTSKIIIVSTPNGMNHFYKMWTDAIEGRSNYIPIEVHWNDVPGRDEKWKEETIRNTSEEQFRQEFECEFIGSTNTLIHPTKLRTLAFVQPKREKWGLDYYQDPIPDHSYVMTVDVSHGVGQDYSAFSIIDVSQIPYRQVAKYRNCDISPLTFPDIIHRYARWYNDANVLVEINDVGQQVAEALQSELEYENVLSTVMKGRAGQKISGGFGAKSQMGVRMTKQVKRIGCSNLKDMIELDKLIITDFETVRELSTFVAKRQSYEAQEGAHDDVVMTLVSFSWLTRQPFFRDLTDTDIRARLSEEKFAAMMDDLAPPGFIDDGQDEDALSIENGRFNSGFWSNGL